MISTLASFAMCANASIDAALESRDINETSVPHHRGSLHRRFDNYTHMSNKDLRESNQLMDQQLRELERRLEQVRQEAERLKAQMAQQDRDRERREQENAKKGQKDKA